MGDLGAGLATSLGLMRTPRPHRVGDTLAGRYRLISPLGEGGFGAAFRAWDNKQGLPVVLKMPLAKHLDRPVVLERFSREVARLRDCRHPHIVPIIDDGRDDIGRPFIVMRFLPGGSLADRRKPVGPKTLHYWLPQVARALDYIHSQGVIHRDVKPPNIFFDTQATAFLGDFGIAKLIDDAPDALSGHDAFIDRIREEESLTRTGGFIGTAVYMAPEGLDERPAVSPRMDQYSLAVTAYEMLSGELPFRGTFDQIRDVHRSRQPLPCPPRLRGLPQSVFSALQTALNRNPENRFSSCEAFAAAALADIPFTPVDSSHHRFMCPGCGRLVRVPDDFGGKSCRCPDCRIALRVSHDLDALWRREEDPTAPELSGSGVVLNRRTTNVENMNHIGALPRDPTINPSISLGAELTDFLEQRGGTAVQLSIPAEDELPTPTPQRRHSRAFHIVLLMNVFFWLLLIGAWIVFSAGGFAAVSSATTGILAIGVAVLRVTTLVLFLPLFVIWLLGRLLAKS
jgi:serine/threonine protein kinase